MRFLFFETTTVEILGSCLYLFVQKQKLGGNDYEK